MPCNPRNPKAKKPEYICNEKTGRWILKARARSSVRRAKRQARFKCNSKNPKAKDPNYMCNPKTGRWVKKTKEKISFSLRESAKRKRAVLVDRGYDRFLSINMKCPERFWRKCRLGWNNFKEIRVGKKIDQGGYGKIFAGSATDFEGVDVDIILKVIRSNYTKQALSDLTTEVDYSYFMGQLDIGPKVYESYFAVGVTKMDQVIVMEKFDIGCGDKIEELANENDVEMIGYIISEISELLKRQVSVLGMICLDIKPSNFVYRESDNVVRMIDYDSGFCSIDNPNINSDRKFKAVHYIMMCQLSLILQHLYSDFGGFKRIFGELCMDINDYAGTMYRLFERDLDLHYIVKYYTDRNIISILDVYDLIDAAMEF